MTKPVITKRATKGSALTYEELDANFQNLDDATISLKAGTDGTTVTSDLNGTITLVAGTGITFSGDNTTKEITVNSTGGNAFGNIVVGGTTVAADAPADTLTLVAGSNITLTPNATTDSITIASSAVSGLTNPLTENIITTSSYGVYSGAESAPMVIAAGATSDPKISLYMDASGTNVVYLWSKATATDFQIGQQTGTGGVGRVQIRSPLVLSPTTTTQRNANSLLSVETGVIYNSTTGTLQIGNNTTGWKTVPSYTTVPTTLSGYGITDAISTAGGTITGDLTVVGTSYDKGISVTGPLANIYLGTNTRTARTVFVTNSATGYYSGLRMDRAGSELWYAGINNAEKYVIRRNSSTDIITVDNVTSEVTLSAGLTVTGAITGNASTATKLAATKNINGVAFDGSADITVTAAADTLTGTALNSTVVSSSLTSVGTLTSLSSGAITTTGTLAVNASGGITTTQTTFPLVNTTATTVNFAGAATSLNMGATSGTTTINNNLALGSTKTISTTGSITSNAATAFIAGDNAISGVALQVPRDGGIRNTYNGNSTIFFDVSNGGSTHGSFQFRSSSAFTNVLSMNPTSVSFSTDATVTSRTPNIGKLSWNSAIDTELTVDDYRFRISNQGGIFPQVISNIAGTTKNTAWTAVGTINAYAITQLGNTGVFVANNAWTTLFNGHGMDAAGDTVVVNLQDKAQGRIYRITFMRSDNGSSTGYNIIAERLL